MSAGTRSARERRCGLVQSGIGRRGHDLQTAVVGVRVCRQGREEPCHRCHQRRVRHQSFVDFIAHVPSPRSGPGRGPTADRRCARRRSRAVPPLARTRRTEGCARRFTWFARESTLVGMPGKGQPSARYTNQAERGLGPNGSGAVPPQRQNIGRRTRNGQTYKLDGSWPFAGRGAAKAERCPGCRGSDRHVLWSMLTDTPSGCISPQGAPLSVSKHAVADLYVTVT